MSVVRWIPAVVLTLLLVGCGGSDARERQIVNPDAAGKPRLVWAAEGSETAVGECAHAVPGGKLAATACFAREQVVDATRGAVALRLSHDAIAVRVSAGENHAEARGSGRDWTVNVPASFDRADLISVQATYVDNARSTFTAITSGCVERSCVYVRATGR